MPVFSKIRKYEYGSNFQYSIFNSQFSILNEINATPNIQDPKSKRFSIGRASGHCGAAGNLLSFL